MGGVPFRFPLYTPVPGQAFEDAAHFGKLLFGRKTVGELLLRMRLSGVSKDTIETELIVVGPTDVEMDYTKELVAFIGRNQLQTRVYFIGALDGDPLIEQYQMADVFVMPAYYESFGIVYLEAMGFGLPTIGTTGGAAVRTLRHTETPGKGEG